MNKKYFNLKVADVAFITVLIMFLLAFKIFPEIFVNETGQKEEIEKAKLFNLYKEWYDFYIEDVDNTFLYSFKEAALSDKSVAAKYKYDIVPKELLNECEKILYNNKWIFTNEDFEKRIYKKDNMICILKIKEDMLEVVFKME
mgnify:FL=1